jgi:hypothetical protein
MFPMINRLYEGHRLRHLGQEGVFTADGVIDASWYHPALKSGQRLGPRARVAVQMPGAGEISSGELIARRVQIGRTSVRRIPGARS